jgi:hypothetical protein
VKTLIIRFGRVALVALAVLVVAAVAFWLHVDRAAAPREVTPITTEHVPPLADTGQLTCASLGRLVQAAMGDRGQVTDTAFVWQVCDPTPEPGILAWHTGGFTRDGLLVAKAAFYYEEPRLDWSALDRQGRLVVEAARGATAEFLFTTETLARELAERANLREPTLTVDIAEATLTGRLPLLGGEATLAATGKFDVVDGALVLVVDEVTLGQVVMPGVFGRRLVRALSPTGALPLADWNLKPAGLRVDAVLNTVVLVAVGR